MAIIESLLDTDLYKFSMQQAVLHQFPDLGVKYAFACRNCEADLRDIAQGIRDEIDAFCTLRVSRDERAFLGSLGYLTDDYLDYLQDFRLDPTAVTVSTEGEQLAISIEGSWCDTILFEVPVLAIVNELFFCQLSGSHGVAEGRERLAAKIETIRREPDNQTFAFADFGTRRRFSREWQREVVATLKREVPDQLAGTSNVALAREFGLTPIGTMAHEWLMAGQVIAPDLGQSQKRMLDIWVEEYGGSLGIALSDVVGMEAFLSDFDRNLAQRYDGVRHDSGDPYRWADKMIAHYREQGIDPLSKTLVFSDGLDVPAALNLYQRYRGQTRLAFGIGTNLTNDLGYTPLQIVIKPVAFDGRPVAKISDSPGKCMCPDPAWIKKLAKTFQVDLGKAA